MSSLCMHRCLALIVIRLYATPSFCQRLDLDPKFCHAKHHSEIRILYLLWCTFFFFISLDSYIGFLFVLNTFVSFKIWPFVYSRNDWPLKAHIFKYNLVTFTTNYEHVRGCCLRRKPSYRVHIFIGFILIKYI